MNTEQILRLTTVGIQRGLQKNDRDSEPAAPSAKQSVHQRFVTAARSALGDGVVLESTLDRESAIKKTHELVASNSKNVFSASLRHRGVTVRIDALRKLNQGWSIICFRKSASVKRQHLADVAVQSWVAIKSGLEIRSIEVMHPNRHAELDQSQDLFKRHVVTDDVFRLLPALSQHILALLQNDMSSEPLETDTQSLQSDSYSVHELYKVRRDTLSRLADMGIDEIAHIPSDFSLSPICRRQREAVIANRLVVDKHLGRILRTLPMPFIFIDFEAITPALPLWPGTKPFESIPVQVSIHIQRESQILEHAAWLARHGGDPRAELAEFVCQNIPTQGTIVAYGAAFEVTCIRKLAQHLSTDLEAKLLGTVERVFDMLPVLRGHVYHPKFRGRFGLKSVAAAMLPDLSYADLPIRSGGSAGIELEAFLTGGKQASSAATREALLAYCHRDTLVLARMFEELMRLTHTTDE